MREQENSLSTHVIPLSNDDMLYSLLNNITDRVYFKDRSLRYVRVNSAYATYHGLTSPEAAIGKTFSDFAAAEWAQEVTSDDLGILKTGKPIIAKTEQVKHPSGRTQWSSTSKVPAMNANGEITGIIGISRDITAEIELRRQIEQTAKMDAIGLLAGGIAHDFNNLLQSILGYTQLLLVDDDQNTLRRQNLLAIERAANKAADLTRQILAFSQKQPISPKIINLNSIAGTAQRILFNLFGDAIHITTELDLELYPVKCDPRQIDQIIVNLATNARDAMPQGGQLTLATRNINFPPDALPPNPRAKPGQFACLSITDSGIGMSPEVFAHLFEPFFTTKSVGQGPGLGLAAVYGIVTQHKGWIDVQSEPGKGTTFNLYFPRMSL